MPSIGSPPGAAPPPAGADGEAAARLRLYVALATPNSVRAQANLASALSALSADLAVPELEVIDVFTQPMRAITDGVIVTPTLIGLRGGRRVVLLGDLADRARLAGTLADLLR